MAIQKTGLRRRAMPKLRQRLPISGDRRRLNSMLEICLVLGANAVIIEVFGAGDIDSARCFPMAWRKMIDGRSGKPVLLPVGCLPGRVGSAGFRTRAGRGSGQGPDPGRSPGGAGSRRSSPTPSRSPSKWSSWPKTVRFFRSFPTMRAAHCSLTNGCAIVVAKFRAAGSPGYPISRSSRSRSSVRAGSERPEYYCDVCAISVLYPQICPCCQGPMELRMRPESSLIEMTAEVATMTMACEIEPSADG